MTNKSDENKAPNLFKVENDYFAELEKQILAKAEGKSFHLPLHVEHPFKAPAGYFEHLDSIIINKVFAEPVSPFTKIWRKYRQSIRVAAAILMVSGLGLSFYLNNFQSAKTDTDYLASYDSETLVAYLENEDLDLTDLSLGFADNDTPLSDFSSNLNLNELDDADLQLLMDL